MTNFRLYILLITGLIFASCGNRHEGEEKPTLLSNALSISDNEDKGIKEVLDFYGGRCEYSVGVTASTSEGKKKYFELEMSKSEAIEKYASVAEMPASNVAYLFYHSLKDKKNNYDEIHTVIIFNDNSKMNFSFSKDKLETVDKKMSVVNKVVDLLKAKNYEGIRPMLNPDTSFLHYDKDELITNLGKADPQFGAIKEFRPFGFRFTKLQDGKEILHISGVLMRDKQSNEFSVDLDPASTKDEIFVMQYKL